MEEDSEAVAATEVTTLHGAESVVLNLRKFFLGSQNWKYFFKALSDMEKNILNMKIQGLKEKKLTHFSVHSD